MGARVSAELLLRRVSLIRSTREAQMQLLKIVAEEGIYSGSIIRRGSITQSTMMLSKHSPHSVHNTICSFIDVELGER